MQDQVLVPLLKERIDSILNLKKTYVEKGDSDNDGISPTESYRLMKKEQPGNIELFCCTETFYSDYSIYSIKVNGIVVAEKDFSIQNYTAMRGTSHSSEAGHEIYEIYNTLKTRYDNAQKQANIEAYKRNELSNVPQQRQAFNYLGQFLPRNKQH